MSANFDIYHFADASNAGMVLLPRQFKNALAHAATEINPADWQATSAPLIHEQVKALLARGIAPDVWELAFVDGLPKERMHLKFAMCVHDSRTNFWDAPSLTASTNDVSVVCLS